MVPSDFDFNGGDLIAVCVFRQTVDCWGVLRDIKVSVKGSEVTLANRVKSYMSQTDCLHHADAALTDSASCKNAQRFIHLYILPGIGGATTPALKEQWPIPSV